MTRVFRSGELQRAVVAVLDEVGHASGYSIMQALAERLGGRWRPSPGAVYPALIGLEDAGLVTTREVGGAKVYGLSRAGELQVAPAREALEGVVARVAGQRPPAPTLGVVLDAFLADVPDRHRELDPDLRRSVDGLLDRFLHDLDTIITKGTT